MQPVLSIGIPVYDDYDGVWFTCQSLVLGNPNVWDRCEIVVVDNHPNTVTDPNAQTDSPHGKATESYVTGWLKNTIPATYVAAPGPGGPAIAKDRCVREARGEYVVVMDSHVLLPPGTLGRLLDFYASKPDTTGLYSGPMVYDNDMLAMATGGDLRQYATHMDEVWRGENLGIWATYHGGAMLDAEPFDIPAMGCGLFSCRKDAFPGFNPEFRGFGGEEFYLHRKAQQQGKAVVCLPFLRWNHRFNRPAGVRYRLDRYDKVRNYVIGHQELKLPLDGIHAHFVATNLVPEATWKYLLEDPVGHTAVPAEATCGGCGAKAAPLPDSMTLEDLYKRASETPSDINEHCAKLRELASQCETVVEFGHRRGVSTTALLAGQPKRLLSFDINEDPFWKELQKRQGGCEFSFTKANVREIEIPEADLLFEDSDHRAEHITAILEKHASKVRRWIALHDTAADTFGETGDGGGPGILPALRKFLREHREWSVVSAVQNNHGFLVISRSQDDKPKLPSAARMAWNLTKAMAAHVAGGAKTTSEEWADARLEVCDTCPQRVGNRCSQCGCYLEPKASLTVSECPLSFWLDVDAKYAEKPSE